MVDGSQNEGTLSLLRRAGRVDTAAAHPVRPHSLREEMLNCCKEASLSSFFLNSIPSAIRPLSQMDL